MIYKGLQGFSRNSTFALVFSCDFFSEVDPFFFFSFPPWTILFILTGGFGFGVFESSKVGNCSGNQVLEIEYQR
jgi:hypothetical protein